MDRHGWMIGAGRALMVVMMVLATAVVPLTRVAEAQEPERATEVVMEEGVALPMDEMERWWGVAGAALCGLEIRLIIRAPAIGMNPYALAAGIAGCSLAMLDIMTTQ